MIICEDFPCCGHEHGDCPDPNAAERGELPFSCVECGGRIKRGEEYPSAPSFHAACAMGGGAFDDDRDEYDYIRDDDLY